MMMFLKVAVALAILGCVSAKNIKATGFLAMNNSPPKPGKKFAIPGKLKLGDRFVFTGILKAKTRRFTTNFYAGKHIAFHLDMRHNYGGRVIVMNTHKGRWQREIRHKWPGNLKPGKFVIVVTVHSKYYVIAINGKKLSKTYPHRIPYKHVSHINHTGDLKWTASKLIRKSGKGKIVSVSVVASAVMKVAKIKPGHKYAIPGKAQLNDVYVFTGIQLKKTRRWTINFYAGPHIAFHLDFRYRYGGRVIVMNTHKGRWQREIRDKWPAGLKPGKAFVIEVRVTPKYYVITVQGKKLNKTYPHRMPYKAVTHFNATGDVKYKSAILYRA